MRGRMKAGPVPRTDGPVVVSLPEFTARRFRDLPGIARDGIGLSRGWWALAGAVGVLLYVEPAQKRGGALSVWANEDDLRRFVALPRHAETMRRHRGHVTVRSATWRTERFRTG